jgi:hypothetical protein
MAAITFRDRRRRSETRRRSALVLGMKAMLVRADVVDGYSTSKIEDERQAAEICAASLILCHAASMSLDL